MGFLAFFVSLPAKATTGRMRVWRSLKTLGCASLRDGVYLLPDSAEHAAALEAVAAEAVGAEGGAEVYRLSGCDDAQGAALRALFDRAEEYAGIAGEVRALRDGLSSVEGASVSRALRSLARRFEQVVRLDFFPGEAQGQVRAMLEELQEAVRQRLAPDEPGAWQVDIPRLDRADYLGRTWATRARPWVDRLACAWLIRSHIDPQARFVWLASPAECRADWLGFDFDGAAFSHVGSRVSFETLLASFGLESDPALARLGELVHCLDVGGLPVAEAAGVEALLAGLRASETDDDRLLDRAAEFFDWLHEHYKEEVA